MAAWRRFTLPFARKQTLFGNCFPRCYATETVTTKVGQGASSAVEQEIVIPFRIQRGPTDILKALATTVGKDYTASHFKYHDDPHFIPVSNAAKRSYALSKESGRKAARYFLENFPEYFKCHTSTPHVQAFDPPVTYKEEDNLTETNLRDCVTSHDLSNSIVVYEMLEKKGISISQETKQMFLELLCFYNEIHPVNLEYSEERWYSLQSRKPKKTWKAKGIAEQIFKDSDKDSAAYCAMIQGTAKYWDVDKAFTLYKEMRSKNLPASVGVYNSLLSLVTLLEESGDMRWDCAMELVSHMNKEGLFPNLFTMNALLGIITRSGRWNKGRAIAMQILAEMGRLCIEPSLGSYYHILCIFFQNNESYLSVFADILSRVDYRHLEIAHPDDVLFFPTAMEICHKFLANKDLGYRLHAVLEKGKNSALFASAFHESVYYRNLFQLLIKSEDIEKFMEFYHRYVPHVYTPEPSVMHEIMLAVELSGAYQHLPQLGSDMVMFQQSDRESLASEFFRIAASVTHEEKIQMPLVEISWKFLEIIDNRKSKMQHIGFQWSGSILGNVLKIFLDGKDLEKARHVMLKLRKDESSIVGYPESGVLLEFCSAFLEAKDFKAVNMCVKYAIDSFYPDIRTDLHKVVEDMIATQKLSSNDRFEVNNVLGKNIEEEEGMNEKTQSETEKQSCSS